MITNSGPWYENGIPMMNGLFNTQVCSLSKLVRYLRQSTLKIYRTIIKPVVMQATETWVLKEMEIRMLSIWERKILRKIYGAKLERN
jgi:hypothetical protein